MIEPLENFETWLTIWTAANLGSFREGDDLSVWVRLRVDELTQDATHAGFYGELVEAAKPASRPARTFISECRRIDTKKRLFAICHWTFVILSFGAQRSQYHPRKRMDQRQIRALKDPH